MGGGVIDVVSDDSADDESEDDGDACHDGEEATDKNVTGCPAENAAPAAEESENPTGAPLW